MESVWKYVLTLLGAVVLSGTAHAQTFTCAVSNNIPYCQYTGKLDRVYINIDKWMLFYFEQSVDIALPASAGFTGISRGDAGAFAVSADPEFAEYFYSTALTAFAGEKTVTIQMRGNVGGYMKVDRIWVTR
ncbi:hypothetical protein SAMN02745824_3360 [Parasphingorhabdus marina DSM 22363]|uniref:Uncharacterized protein n=1 Tax=Parasphingorhabdus marina DSM 22363 TaxID=1123272 RepID=A0A1N6HMK7_9SPHN|nr:hypothetical protein [Parasphingorhabdus marina]SIO20919.1 hypothetical protein SAMN02745824_3360 [Parasphingorhabdus marina DSM 22363]